MTNTAIVRISALFVALFFVLAARQAWVSLIAAPGIVAKPYNPRHALLAGRRGRILATDGTVLAQSVGDTRVYPFAQSLSQTLGYVSARYGTSGVEDAYDRALTPAETTGDPMAQFQEITAALQGRSSVSRGADVVTTIVPAIQKTLYARLSTHARGAGVVLDPASGAVLAIASVPAFDPNTIETGFAALNANASSPLLDRALDGLYPPGSTFKIFTAASALDSGAVSMASHFEDPGYLTIGDFTLHNDESEATGYSDLTRAFALSSNVDFAQIALKMGTDSFYEYLTKWGIGDSLDFQLPTEHDRVPGKDTVVPGELAQMGFGQGALLMTPLRMVLVASAIANGGNEPRPYLVRQIVRDGTVSSVFSTGTLASPVSADVAANVKKMMVAVVQYGTGTVARLPHVVVAGKTGTATNPQGKAHSWFVCFAPADHPRVAVAVIVENAGYGADVAAPIARDVLQVALQSIKG